MAIIYDKVLRPNPQIPMLPKKWYATIKSVTQVNEKEVARQIADEITLNAKEAEFALLVWVPLSIESPGRTIGRSRVSHDSGSKLFELIYI